MGSTCASFHVLWRGGTADAARAVSRAYTGLGYERTKKPAAGGKQVILLARPGEPYVSIYDSTNADLDSGELKDAALAASRLLRTGAVFTSLYDSDSYEFVIFSKGRQVDLLMSDVENYAGPLKQLGGKSRVTQWGKIFARTLTADRIEQATADRSPFAEATLANLCGLIGLPGGRPQMHHGDFEHEPDAAGATLYFTRKPLTRPAEATGQIALRNYYDRDNSRKLLVWPAAWPMPVEQEEILTWLMLSEGAGFRGGTATVEVAGPDGLVFSKGFMNGAKFHNGQIVGGYELPKDAPLEVAQSYLESKRFSLTEAGPASADTRSHAAEYPNLWVPPMTSGRTTQILVVFQLHVVASMPGEWDVRVTLHPGSETGPVHILPPARVAAVARWLPVVSGLNPKATYDASDVAEDRLPDSVLDYLVRRTGDPRRLAIPAVEARATLADQFAQGRERNHKAWLHDLQYKQGRIPRERRLEYPAIASNVAILRDREQETLDICRSYLEDWLRPLIGEEVEVRIRAARQMTETAHVGKLKKTLPAASVLTDKIWARLFDHGAEYQAVVVEFVRAGAEFPFAGMGLHCSLQSRIGSAKPDPELNAYNERMIALTLGKMRGGRFGDVPPGSTVNVFNWVIAHDASYRYLETSAADMKGRIDGLARRCDPLQAWHGQATWIPCFDNADGYEDTVYEGMSVLNFFRGILLDNHCTLKERRMTAEWCGNVLRMVTPHMWLCGDLMAQVSRADLERVAIVTEIDGSHKIEKRPDSAMEDLELALLPILPIENARLTVVPAV